ncbi:CNNM domain-containing protein [Antrihabitans stalactiti]|uniref:HlyC/CorC family transporter n=1 Tax=Antrihabitans stalactiti TaxID=2584121 RepID=A0A848KGD6_9NOCA|nr:hemolysin family protein [Antrihabitans stalactiti]NMN94987.1 HlyC/CorC family transporter [Antrihabitans stalactiti]
MDNPWLLLLVTVGLIGASAFFVAVEFALIAARRHRLEDAATTSRAARAALRSASELSVLLAGSQLGITVCTLALGAITKPAVHHWLNPLFERWVPVVWVADVGAFLLALIIVTFLHLVVGEMAPKSWAIAHPERSATLLAIPMRGFMWLTRPLLIQLNHLANWCLVKVGVEPVDQLATGQDPQSLRQLVEHSADAGVLDEQYRRHIADALDLETLTIGGILRPNSAATSVGIDAVTATIRAASHRSGHLRLLVTGADGIEGVVHVRDTLRASAPTTARDLMRPVLILTPDTPVYEALRIIRDARSHLVVVQDADQRSLGVVTLSDILERLMRTAA